MNINNCDWETGYIGIKVKDYNSFNEKEKMKSFCSKYKLPDPVMFAGIYGEFE